MKLPYRLNPAPKPTPETRALAPAPVPAQAWRRTAWSLSDWLDHARQIEGRRPSCHRYTAAARHCSLWT